MKNECVPFEGKAGQDLWNLCKNCEKNLWNIDKNHKKNLWNIDKRLIFALKIKTLHYMIFKRKLYEAMLRFLGLQF